MTQEHPSAWRLPAPAFENLIARAIERHLADPEIVSTILTKADVAKTAALAKACYGSSENGTAILDLIERVDLSSGSLSIVLDRTVTAMLLKAHPDQIEGRCLSFTAPFTQRRRGVETKLIIGGRDTQIDQTLLRNVAKGHRYFNMICSGLSYAEIAEREKTSKRMVQHLAEFAFLAPDIIAQICDGSQPTGLTTEWLKRNKIPVQWSEQSATFEWR